MVAECKFGVGKTLFKVIPNRSTLLSTAATWGWIGRSRCWRGFGFIVQHNLNIIILVARHFGLGWSAAPSPSRKWSARPSLVMEKTTLSCFFTLSLYNDKFVVTNRIVPDSGSWFWTRTARAYSRCPRRPQSTSTVLTKNEPALKWRTFVQVHEIRFKTKMAHSPSISFVRIY